MTLRYYLTTTTNEGVSNNEPNEGTCIVNAGPDSTMDSKVDLDVMQKL